MDSHFRQWNQLSTGVFIVVLAMVLPTQAASPSPLPTHQTVRNAGESSSEEATILSISGEINVDAFPTVKEDEKVGNAVLDAAYSHLSTMSLSEKIGQLMIITIRYQDSREPPIALTDSFRELLSVVQPAGVIVYSENIDSVPQVLKLISDIQSHLTIPPFIAIDEEGGIVSRLQRSDNISVTDIPSAAEIGSTNNPHSAYLAYSVIGRELAALGFNMNLAPVADILSNRQNREIAERAFGTDPQQVSSMVAAAVGALQEQRVMSVIKHFPGLGATEDDSHFVTPLLSHSLNRLQQFEFLPFVAGIEADAAGILTAHVSIPSIDSTPASLSSVFVDTIIRTELNYSGLVITDALEMRGIGNIAPAEAGVQSIQAGTDILLVPPNPMQQRDYLLYAVEQGEIAMKSIDESVHRVLQSKYSFGIIPQRPPLSVEEVYTILGNESHQQMLHQALHAE